ncbi:MAG TPA: hypothetical protein DCW52_02385 [Gammaproteobacteria bacterium]|nr:hypothetical protein [Gammaproteobacteria bacterium]
MDGRAIIDYFAPLNAWLEEQKKDRQVAGSFTSPLTRQCFAIRT